VRSDRERLLDILDAIASIERNVRSRDFLDDEVGAAAATRWLEVIGEAASYVSSELREGHRDVAWRGPIDMRNRLIHGYFDITPDRLWETIVQDLPVLKAQVQAMVEELPG